MPTPSSLTRDGYELEVEDEFDGSDLNSALWLPYYLPHWSSRESAAARYEIGGGRLRLGIDVDQPAWNPQSDRHTRVSSLQTGEFAGPVGTAIGQHRFRDELVVREAQPAVGLYTPQYGLFECRARAITDPANMVALWMIGFEDEAHRSAEICIFEIFGRDVRADACLVGMGLHPFGDPLIRDEFEKVPVAMDATEPHDYAAEWTPDQIAFYVNERLVKVVDQSPTYPMQFMLSLYEFRPTPSPPSPPHAYPKVFEVEWFRASRRPGISQRAG